MQADEDNSGAIGKEELAFILRDSSLMGGAFCDRALTPGPNRRMAQIPGLSDDKVIEAHAQAVMELVDLRHAHARALTCSGNGLLDFDEFYEAFGAIVNEDGSINNKARQPPAADMQTILHAQSTVLHHEVERLRRECWDWQQRCSHLEEAGIADVNRVVATPAHIQADNRAKHPFTHAR